MQLPHVLAAGPFDVAGRKPFVQRRFGIGFRRSLELEAVLKVGEGDLARLRLLAVAVHGAQKANWSITLPHPVQQFSTLELVLPIVLVPLKILWILFVGAEDAHC